MNAMKSRAAIVTGGVALTSALLLPSAALAAEGDKNSSKSQGQGQSQPANNSSKPESKPESQPSSAPANSSSAKSDKPADKPSDKPANASSDKPAKAQGDPAGNNGTIKIQPYGGVAGNANDPKPGCDFRLQMFGFDDDQTGTITFVGQAPTDGAVTTQPLAGTRLLSDDAAGGGQDADAFYDVRGASLGLTGTPHAQQGYHIKVLVDADNAPGGAKQKVFWLDCPATPEAPVTASGSEDSEEITGVESGAVGLGDELPTGGTLSDSEVLEGSLDTARSESLTSTASTQTGVLSGAAETAAVQESSNPFARVAAGQLPFTGAAGVLTLAALGGILLAAGYYALRLGRRRSTV